MWFVGRIGSAARRPDGSPAGSGAPHSILGHLHRRAQAVARCRRGIYAVEFGQVVVIAVGLMMGAIEIGWQFLASIALENAALEASRAGSLGRANADGSRRGSACASEVKQAAVAAGAGILKASRLTVTPRQYATASALVDEDDEAPIGTGTAGTFVMYTLSYDQPLLFFGEKRLFMGTEVRHQAKAAVMNEPYPNANAPAPCPA